VSNSAEQHLLVEFLCVVFTREEFFRVLHKDPRTALLVDELARHDTPVEFFFDALLHRGVRSPSGMSSPCGTTCSAGVPIRGCCISPTPSWWVRLAIWLRPPTAVLAFGLSQS